MDLDKIVAELKSERDRLANVIRLLENGEVRRHRNASVASQASQTKPNRVTKGRDAMTPAGRARQIAATKARWKRWREEHQK